MNYININAALRDYPNQKDKKKKEETLAQASEISSIISENSTSYGNFITYRGVTLDYFKDYGIKTIEDLTTLQDKFMIDKGFISTALIPERSFFGKETYTGERPYKIMIEYMIPEEFTDGLYIGNNPMFSHHPYEEEYLINSNSLSKVTSVQIDDDTAKIQTVMIPKSLYNDYHKGNNNTK